MLERNFISYIQTESYLLFTLGLCILTLSRITPISFGTILFTSFFIYGGYKAINAFILKKYIPHYILDITIGFLVICMGIVLYIFPLFDITPIFAFLSLYFMLEAISSTSFSFLLKKIIPIWKLNFILVIIQFSIGLFIILLLPTTAIWLIGFFVGINFLITGFVKIVEFISAKYHFYDLL